jgi:hypothetical protein
LRQIEEEEEAERLAKEEKRQVEEEERAKRLLEEARLAAAAAETRRLQVEVSLLARAPEAESSSPKKGQTSTGVRAGIAGRKKRSAYGKSKFFFFI